jgi:hypothetical protein
MTGIRGDNRPLGLGEDDLPDHRGLLEEFTSGEYLLDV